MGYAIWFAEGHHCIPVINLNIALKQLIILNFLLQGFAELVSQHPRRLIRHVQIAGKLESRKALRSDDKDGAGSHAELNKKRSALELSAGADS